MPGGDQRSALEEKGFWSSFQRGAADSEAHTSYLEECLDPMGSGLRAYRNARLAIAACTASAETQKFIDDHEACVAENNLGLEFRTACRTSFMLFDGNESVAWTYASPPALYRPGSRTGDYQVKFDVLPLKGDDDDSTNLDGRLHGNSAADLAIATADEAVTQEKKWRHWTAFADLSDDSPTSVYARL